MPIRRRWYFAMGAAATTAVVTAWAQLSSGGATLWNKIENFYHKHAPISQADLDPHVQRINTGLADATRRANQAGSQAYGNSADIALLTSDVRQLGAAVQMYQSDTDCGLEYLTQTITDQGAQTDAQVAVLTGRQDAQDRRLTGLAGRGDAEERAEVTNAVRMLAGQSAFDPARAVQVYENANRDVWAYHVNGNKSWVLYDRKNGKMMGRFEMKRRYGPNRVRGPVTLLTNYRAAPTPVQR